MVKNITTLFILLAFFILGASQGLAAEVMFFDSTNNYLGACQLTNKSEWELKEDENVTKFEVWYSWNQGEINLPVKLFLNGEKFAEFEAVRSSCDPYQKQWCNADFMINKLFPAGKYSTEIPNSRQCLKPGGTGAIRLYKSEDEVEPTSSQTDVPTITMVPTTIVAQPTVKNTPTTVNVCSCNRNEILIGAATTSGVVSLLISILLRKR